MELAEALRQNYPVSDETIKKLESVATLLSIKKRNMIVEQGVRTDSIFFVRKGIFRVSFCNDDKENTICFGLDGDPFTSIHSLFNNEPSQFSCIALTNAEVYKRAIITKQLFSKIKLNPEYHPDKATAMRLCIGAKLNLDETKDLLARAGYALSPCDRRDIIFSYFIEKEVYDMIDIDIVLEENGLPCFIE